MDKKNEDISFFEIINLWKKTKAEMDAKFKPIESISLMQSISNAYKNAVPTNQKEIELLEEIKENVGKRSLDLGALIQLVQVEENLSKVKDLELAKLIRESVDYFSSKALQDRQVGIEKLWDAFERLKSYYDKKGKEKDQSTKKIINSMSHGHMDYYKLFENEFWALKEIGNNYRIRHHEITKIEIIDDNYYDYFFNRCLALINLAILYLE